MDLNKIKSLAERYFSEMVEIRRHLHQYPEVSYKEYETTKFIINKLEELGIPYERPLETGCVGILEGGKPGEKVVALRTDIDALAMQEEGEHKQEFISRNKGVAHCCGHDGHMANMLGVAHILSELKDEIEGKVLLIFQPAEEKLPGGGRLLCETGFLQEQGVDVIYGLHMIPSLKPGEIGIRKGPLMARPDEFKIEIIGTGGHAAAPQSTVDPIVVAAEVVSAVQTIVSRNVDPTEPAVVTIGKISGGTTHNVIPERVEMLGTIRTFSEETTRMISGRIESLVKGISEANGASYGFDFYPGYPAVINTDWAVDTLKNTATRLFGEHGVHELEKPIMAGEDFAFYQQHFPGSFFFLGSGSEESGSVYTWHHPRYNIDEQAFKTGAALMASLAFQPIEKDGQDE